MDIGTTIWNIMTFIAIVYAKGRIQKIYDRGENATVHIGHLHINPTELIEITFFGYTSKTHVTNVMLYETKKDKDDSISINKNYSGRITMIYMNRSSLSFLLLNVDFLDSGRFTVFRNSQSKGDTDIFVARQHLIQDIQEHVDLMFTCNVTNTSMISLELMITKLNFSVVKYNVTHKNCTEVGQLYENRIERCVLDSSHLLITIRNLNIHDMGMYVVWDDKNILLDSIRLLIRDETLIPRISEFWSNEPDYLLVLKCHSFRSYKGNFSWMINGSLVKHNDKYSPKIDLLYVRHLTVEDQKNTYTCSEPGSNLQSDPFWINTSGPTTITFSPKMLVVKEGEGINVSCLADCSLLCSFIWFKLKVSSRQKEIYSKENALQIRNVGRDMSGTYSCNIQNIISGAVKESSVMLNVLYGPDKILFNTSTNITEVDEFHSITIQCTANCFPKCLLSWNGRNRKDVFQNGSDLMLVNVTKDGVFTCHASNPEISNSTIYETIIVKVKYDAKLTPRIGMVKYNDSDSSIVLKCLSSRETTGQFIWRVNGSMIINRYEYSKENQFLQRTLSTNDQYNAYTCTEPGSGLQSEYFSSKIYGPDELFFITSTNTTKVHQFSSTTVSCSADCFPPCLFRWDLPDFGAVIEGPKLILVNVTSNVSLTCHATNPIQINFTLFKSIDILVQLDTFRQKMLPPEHDQPLIRYLLYDVLVIGGLGLICTIVYCLFKKYKSSTRATQISINHMNERPREGESNQDPTLLYWRRNTNAINYLPTFVQSDVDVELRQRFDSPINNTVSQTSEDQTASNSDYIEVVSIYSD